MPNPSSSSLHRRCLRALLPWLCGLCLGLAQAESARQGEYQLGPGDSIRIGVFQNPDLTVETRVSENGNITFPLVGAVRVGGLGIAEAESAVAGRLRQGGYVRQPQVNILVLQIKGTQVSVLGQVGRPGRYPIETAGTRLTDMLALAGGASPVGADTVILTGIRDGRPYRREIDIPALFLDGKALDQPVAAGDTLYVHRAPLFYIYGEVQRAGSYRLERGMTVLQGLAQGGGLTARGTERGLRLHRRDGEGRPQVSKPGMDQPLQPDDVLYIQESLF